MSEKRNEKIVNNENILGGSELPLSHDLVSSDWGPDRAQDLYI